MVKEYEMTGACPVIVSNYGRVEPGSANFQCEMEAAQEAFFVKIGAVRVVKELPDATHAALPPEPIDGGVDFEGRTLKTWPTSWPRRSQDEEA